MMVSAPFSAPACPPDTGASSTPMPPAAPAAASSRAIFADTVVWSTNSAPGAIAANAPSGPSVTCRRSSSLPTHASTTAVPAAASAGVAARLPPCAATHASAFAAVRL